MEKQHTYATSLVWTGNKGSGTMDYRSYDRSFTVSVAGKPEILGSSDSAFMGDTHRYNPEDLLLASISSCHMLWYLHLCANNNIVVLEYKDNATGEMAEEANGRGKFSAVTLLPNVTIANKEHIDLANSLHAEANKMCFIANSLNFPVTHKPTTKASE